MIAAMASGRGERRGGAAKEEGGGEEEVDLRVAAAAKYSCSRSVASAASALASAALARSSAAASSPLPLSRSPRAATATRRAARRFRERRARRKSEVAAVVAVAVGLCRRFLFPIAASLVENVRSALHDRSRRSLLARRRQRAWPRGAPRGRRPRWCVARGPVRTF